jgi:hypothetical protein
MWRHSSPSSSKESCARVSGIVPSAIAGQQNWPFSSRFVSRQIPVPSHHNNFTLLVARFDRKTKIADEYASS